MTFFKNQPRTMRVITLFAVLLLLFCAVCGAYLGDYYRADMTADTITAWISDKTP